MGSYSFKSAVYFALISRGSKLFGWVEAHIYKVFCAGLMYWWPGWLVWCTVGFRCVDGMNLKELFGPFEEAWLRS